jgi:glyoxylase-like metal-dependent hydrolase (beta-lactamase superfamily II)
MHRHSRRGFLARTLGAVWTSASLLERSVLRAAQARAQSKAPQPVLFDIEKVADGVYGAVARGRALINSNAAIFELADGLLIVDAHAAPSAVHALTAQIRREVTSKPVKYVVTSHLHGDHTQGLPAYRAIAPSADIIACAKTRDLLVELGPARLKSAVDGARSSVENLKRRLAAAKSAEEKAWLEEMTAQTQAFVDEMRDVPVELPNVTFQDHMTIHDRSGDLHLTFRGRGHTAGDIVLYCPQKKVVATGDLMHSFFPTIGDGYPRDWPGTLKSIDELEFDSAVGGHGGVLHGKDRVMQWRVYFDEMIETVGRAKQSQTPLDRMLAESSPASFKSLAAGGFGDYLTSNVKRLDFRLQLNTPAEVTARGLRDNLTSVYRNWERT